MQVNQYGAIEAGGTKFNCAVSDEQLNIIDAIAIPTTTTAETLEQVFQFFNKFESIVSMGVGSFGPIGIDQSKKNYGYILATPKAGWENFDLLGTLKKHFDCPIAWTTDVNAAAYGELKLGAAKGKNSCIYLTIGTGIGGGIIVNQKIYEGFTHPEMGHIRIKRQPQDLFVGTCPYHEDCLEGLAAGPSLEGRTGISGKDIGEENPVWELQADYIAQALMNYTLILAPEVIILGGGVMNQKHLLTKIRKAFLHQLSDYIEFESVDSYIVEWGLPNQSGILGCLSLAKDRKEMN